MKGDTHKRIGSLHTPPQLPLHSLHYTPRRKINNAPHHHHRPSPPHNHPHHPHSNPPFKHHPKRHNPHPNLRSNLLPTRPPTSSATNVVTYCTAFQTLTVQECIASSCPEDTAATAQTQGEVIGEACGRLVRTETTGETPVETTGLERKRW
ncbi:hypothetical protein BC829DRAFT_144199 [Chytridium lagenaria]|nr:hypothetical protein BC829DRAFT_144199 [Chytridium lagenaria]